ncbi:30S ribosomal protein S4E [Candidatus Bilamarchaeum dharawalense]|uniref:Small ribosomal subunit protein eS4 n=1 Tax=Candidatus Bilamarchaeum dharawalense TaxID=2885759 RepID=A0A5E4LNQ1_9ARCH|nr:30S ribosomal protein S4E [Candidatus Bilamarchaeum dharawalense]
MAKRGGTKHLKRIASPKAIPVHDRKERKWMIKAIGGPHPKKNSIPLGVLVRDVLKVATTLREVRKVLSNRLVLVDGKARTDEKFTVGLMDVVSFPKSGKNFRIVVDHKGRLLPVEISKEKAEMKICKVVKKHTIPGGKLNFTFHDGRNMLGDNHVRVGDSVLLTLSDGKMKNHLKRDKGSRCLVMEGTHAGKIVTLKDIIERKGGKPSEAIVQDSKEEFITVAKYLFVVDENFKGES